jgi:hypothetical protein
VRTFYTRSSAARERAAAALPVRAGRASRPPARAFAGSSPRRSSPPAPRRACKISPGPPGERRQPGLRVKSKACPRRTGRQQDAWIRSHPVTCQRRTRNLPVLQGLAALGLRQTLSGPGEPEYGLHPGDGMTPHERLCWCATKSWRWRLRPIEIEAWTRNVVDRVQTGATVEPRGGAWTRIVPARIIHPIGSARPSAPLFDSRNGRTAQHERGNRRHAWTTTNSLQIL